MAGAGQVVEAGLVARGGADEGVGQVVGEGRAAELVVDDAQQRSLAAQPQHGLDEIGTFDAVDPRGAEDHGVRAEFEDGALARLL